MLFGRRYRVTEKIGSGGMADVFKAVDEVLGRTVAVKVLHPRYAADPSFAARFRQEAQAAANLQSPYIVNMYDWGQDGDTYYIVMEYVRGTDLKTIIQQKGALDSMRVAEIGSQVCAALSVAHGYDIIHRDVKPHNIMVTPDGTVKVMDFGIARAGNTTMTQTGSVLGTAHYVSPEQAQGRPLTASSDLYSLGVVLYEAATGRLPFDADSPVAVALKQVNDTPRAPREINPNIDAGLERVIMTALAKHPAERYETADEMRRDLQRVVQGHEVQATSVMPVSVPGQRTSETAVMPPVAGGAPAIRPVPRRRPIWPWLLLAVLLIAAGLAFAWQQGLLGPQGAQVPDVIGMQQADAENKIVEAGFTLGSVKSEFNNTAPAGQVLDQSPVGLATAEKGTPVNLVVSKGAKMVDVPKILGLSEEEARAAIQEAGLTSEPLPDAFNADYDAGVVFQQSPSPGTSVKEGSAVQYVVSRGKRTVTVPGVEGLSRKAAEAALRKANLRPSVSEQFDETVAKGLVISQNPGKGIEVVEGSPVAIVVSKGAELIQVPDVIGAGQVEAVATLENAGFVVKVNYEPHAENGVVLEQDPKAPTKLKRGETVTILVDAVEP